MLLLLMEEKSLAHTLEFLPLTLAVSWAEGHLSSCCLRGFPGRSPKGFELFCSGKAERRALSNCRGAIRSLNEAGKVHG